MLLHFHGVIGFFYLWGHVDSYVWFSKEEGSNTLFIKVESKGFFVGSSMIMGVVTHR